MVISKSIDMLRNVITPLWKHSLVELECIAPRTFWSCSIKEIDSLIILGNESSRLYGNRNPQTVLHLESFLECGEEQINIVFKSVFFWAITCISFRP